MKDILQVLVQKQEQLRQCRIEVFCLKTAIRLLKEEGDQVPQSKTEEVIDL